MSTDNKCLVILDTTLSGFAIGVAELGTAKVIWQWVSLQQEGTALIDIAWHQAMSEISDRKLLLAGVCVANGPGSFTGIKIGLSFVQGLARGDRQNLFFVCRSSLTSLANYYKGLDESCRAVILPATKTRGAAAFISSKAISINDIDTTQELSEFDGDGNIYLSAPWPMLESRLLAKKSRMVCIHVDREQILKISIDALARNFVDISYDELGREYAEHKILEPFYLRASTAEEVKFGKSKT